MKQFMLSGDASADRQRRFSGKDYHYLVDVRRMKPGDSLHALDECGNHFHLTVEDVDAGELVASIQKRAAPSTKGPRIRLYQCLPKGRKFDQIIRQATEAGVHELVPVHSEHTIRDVAGKWNRLTQRYEAVIREAVQQSGNVHAPALLEPVRSDEIEPHGSDGVGIFFHQYPLADSHLHGYLNSDPTQVSLVVGPEGGLSDRETALLTEKGFHPAYLGPFVLRTETAAIYAIAAVQTILLERASWTLK